MTFVILLTGCARTVTPIVAYGDQIIVDVTLRGTVDLANTRYFLVLSDNGSYQLPLPEPYLISATPEFIEPDMTPQIGSREAYFSRFFTTWSGYVVLDANGYFLAKGPFSLNQALTREALAEGGEATTKLHFSFRLNRVFAALPDYIYFDFVTVPWPVGAPKEPADHLPSTGNRISKIAGSIVTVNDESNDALPANQDVIECRVAVQ
ncbi:hypothetical protein HZB07_06445 [Candidatus Saganbacteria bacterium]|nr:hypothetical protein [Candidatus Saganbacteria bacterium]